MGPGERRRGAGGCALATMARHGLNAPRHTIRSHRVVCPLPAASGLDWGRRLKQPPLAGLLEDREARLHHGRSGRQGYLVALPVVAAVVAVALLGMLGSKVAPEGKVRPSASGALAIAPGSPSPAHTLRADDPAPSPFDIPGFSTIRVNIGDTVTEGLPPDTLPLDADGGNFLYATGDNLFVLTSTQTTVSVGAARSCGHIERAAMSG